MILVLALGAPGGSRSGTGPATLSARGPLMQIDEHPEWRQFLMQAALRRADALAQLRELADEPLRDNQDPGVKVSVLPVERSDAEPEDVTGTVNVAPTATIPIEIGETSSTEITTVTPEERPPVVRPGQVKSKIEIKKKSVRRSRRPKPPVKPPEPANIFEAIFGITPTRQASTTIPASQPGVGRTDTSTR